MAKKKKDRKDLKNYNYMPPAMAVIIAAGILFVVLGLVFG